MIRVANMSECLLINMIKHDKECGNVCHKCTFLAIGCKKQGVEHGSLDEKIQMAIELRKLLNVAEKDFSSDDKKRVAVGMLPELNIY